MTPEMTSNDTNVNLYWRQFSIKKAFGDPVTKTCPYDIK